MDEQQQQQQQQQQQRLDHTIAAAKQALGLDPYGWVRIITTNMDAVHLPAESWGLQEDVELRPEAVEGVPLPVAYHHETRMLVVRVDWLLP